MGSAKVPKGGQSGFCCWSPQSSDLVTTEGGGGEVGAEKGPKVESAGVAGWLLAKEGDEDTTLLRFKSEGRWCRPPRGGRLSPTELVDRGGDGNLVSTCGLSSASDRSVVSLDSVDSSEILGSSGCLSGALVAVFRLWRREGSGSESSSDSSMWK